MPDTSVQLPIPLPLRVPWMVSPSTPFLRLVASESAAQGDTYVEFVAYYQCEDKAPASSSSVRVVRPPGPFQLADGRQSGPYRLIRMTFRSGIWVRMSPAHSDTQVVDGSLYNWSQIARRSKSEDIFEYLNRYREMWQRSGICPDPRAYELTSSSWLNETGSSSDIGAEWKHYLILGHDSYAEVIAAGYDILEGQMLSEW